MSALHPQVVWCSITGFGSTGPNAAAGGHDLTFLGISGLLDQLADGPATPPATTISLPLAASHAALGILAGVLEARRSGVGARLEVSMADRARKSVVWGKRVSVRVDLGGCRNI